MRVGGQIFADGLKRIGVPLLAALALAGLARAADAPSQAPSPDCFRSLYDYLNASATDCPLTYAGLTLYGTVDAGYGFETNGAPFNRAFGPGDAYLVSRATSGPRWLLSPNALSSSVIGLKVSEPLGGGWSLVGDFEFGFDPYSLELSDSPRSLAENNGLPLLRQSSNGDSSRAGQIDNSQGFVGVSNPTYGILTFGRVNTLSLDLVNAYDPMQASNAFSPLGWSGSFAGFGDTEVARANTAFKYRLETGNFRVGGLAQVGGYDQGNGSNGQYQAGIGADFGALSLDGTVSWTRDAVSLANYTALPKGYTQDDLKATLSNNAGAMLAAKYTIGPMKVFGGYEYYRLSDPSNTYPSGFRSLGGFNVLPGAITYNAYAINKVVNVVWTGVKYSVTDQIDLTGAFYYEAQNDYSAKACTGAGVHTSSSACAGSLDALSFLIDYRPVKRIDLYAGVMISNAYGGLANGYVEVQNVDPTVGLRIKF
ncbi:MAG: porin [Hyphomicrobiales bacterium]|nr:porin [Hyphomicrobiales bacterium]